MARGRLDPPNLDDRTWEDLKNQALALRKTYNPNWTDESPSDLGVTLVELFAWLVEGMLFRLNQVPERSYIEFLNLLGVTRDPTVPASTVLRYAINPAGPAITLPAGTQATTTPTEKAAAIVFETDENLVALPTDLAEVWYQEPDQTAASNQSVVLAVAAPTGGAADTQPGVMIKTVTAGKKASLYLGFTAKPPGPAVSLPLRIGINDDLGRQRFTLAWSVSIAGSGLWSKEFPGSEDGTVGLTRTGRVAVAVPAEHHGVWLARPATDLPGVTVVPPPPPRFWLRVTFDPPPVTPLPTTPTGAVLKYVLFNAVPATAALAAVPNGTRERLGTTTGQAFESFSLAKTPVYRIAGAANPYQHVRLVVIGPDGVEDATWTAADDWPPEGAKVYRLSPAAGTVQFGSFDATTGKGRGLIPKAGSTVFAVAYRTVATGSDGNVPVRMVVAQQTVVNGVVSVTNPLAATGGGDEEALAAALQRAPELIRNRDRAITTEDTEYLTYEVSAQVHHARCLAADDKANGLGGIIRTPGSVAVIVVKKDTSGRKAETPQDLLDAVARDLGGRRPLTASIAVYAPRYRAVAVTLTVFLFDNAVGNTDAASRKDRIKAALTNAVNGYLHPVTGNGDGQGWEVGQSFFLAGLVEVIQPLLAGQGYIQNLTAVGNPEYKPPFPVKPILPELNSAVGVGVANFELVCPAETHSISFNP